MSETELADSIAAAVLAVPGVAALHPGMFGEVGTYLPGRRVTGVRITDDEVTHSFGHSLNELVVNSVGHNNPAGCSTSLAG